MEVVFRNVSFSYNKNTPFETKALKDINLFLQAESLEQFRELRLKRDEF